MLCRLAALVIASCALVTGVGEALPSLPETARARERLRTLMTSGGRILPGSLLLLEDGHPVRFQIVEREDAIYYLFLNQGEAGDFPLVWEGNASVKRRRSDGALQYLTLLVRRDPHSYVRLHPAGGRVRLEVVLFGVALQSNVMLPLRFEDALALSVERIVALTRTSVDWDVMLDRGRPSEAIRRMLAAVRKALPLLKDEDDGAFDVSGRPVLIATGLPSGGGLNCSGFAKWIVDGFYRPLTGRYTDIEALKRPEPGSRGNRWTDRYESERDPYFGLDWTRHLAVELERARTGRELGVESLDVRRLPYLEYVEDVGYPVDRLGLALYLLAREDPDRFYLGSVNEEFGTDPVLRQHTHVVVLVPHFQESGEFRVCVLERNAETTLDGLRERHAGSYVHLVKVSARGEFSPLIPGGSR